MNPLRREERRAQPRRGGPAGLQLGRWEEVNKELWLLLSMFAIAALVNFLVASNRVVLTLYFIPTLFAAYHYGRRQATLTAMGSVLLVVLVVYFSPNLAATAPGAMVGEQWYDIGVWGGILILTGYAMGSLYETKEAHIQELRETYHGILIILRQFISKDKYTQNHSYRVSVYAAQIAAYLGLDPERVEDVRAAALLHDIGKLDISRDILYKAARLSESEYKEMQKHVEMGVDMLKHVGGSLRTILPIVLSHHDRFDGSGYHPTQGDNIPIEARIIAVADVFDSLTSDRPYRKAIAPHEARDIILKGSGTDFDPRVVKAFVTAFSRGDLEVPEIEV
ncbi:MAG: HD domain-containing phosphohydrolase [Candidatus Acidiferrales bacterium]